MSDLPTAIINALIIRPYTFAQLEKAIGRQEDYALGIALLRLVLDRAVRKHCTNVIIY